MPYWSSQARMAACASLPPGSSGNSSRKLSSFDVLQKRHDLRMRGEDVCDLKERQPHLRADVVGDGLGERVGRILLTEPRLHLFVEPPRGLHPGQDHLMARRIEQDPLRLPEILQDEAGQRGSGLRVDVPLRGDGGLGAPNQVGDDRRIGLDRRTAHGAVWLEQLRSFLHYFVQRDARQKLEILDGPIKTGDFARHTRDGESRERLREVFNTPLYPMILIANEVMQEGLDLHKHCRRVVHHDLVWNAAQVE
jgi:hypothetical protein